MATDETPSAGSVELPPSFAQRVRRGSVAMTINLIIATVILAAGAIVEGTVNSSASSRGWVIYLGLIPVLAMLGLAVYMLRARTCLDGDTLNYADAAALRPSLRLWWLIIVVSALVVIVLILLLDFLHNSGSSGSAIFGAVPPFLAGVVGNTSYGTAKSWLNPKLD